MGPYLIVAAVGAGGMGEVHRARDTRLNRDVALKILPEALAGDSEHLLRFQHEAELLSALNHPNLLSIYDIGESAGARYFISELLEGQTLRARLLSGLLSPRRSVEYAVQIATGLAAAHDKNIVHRDLKPENIFITKDERIKILDFGLAKLRTPTPVQTRGTVGSAETMAATQTAKGVVLGTAGYMSPEQVRGEIVDHRSDLFAFGAVLYEMLSGLRAFHRESAADTMAAILKDDVPELTSATDVPVPVALDRIVRRCLEKAPEQRFQSAKDLNFALQNLDIASSSKLAASKTGPRWRTYSVVIAAACLLLGVFVVAFRNASPTTFAPPRFVQLTNDAYAKATAGWPPPVVFSPIVGDGSRLYTSVRSEGGIVVAQVSSVGGEMVPITLPFRNAAVLGISHDRSRLLVESFTSQEVEDPEWLVPVLGGSPQRIGNFTAHDITWSHDQESFAYASGKALYARSSSGQERKLFEAKGTIVWPRWSPDGRKIRFTLQEPSRIASAIWEANPDGSGARPLFSDHQKDVLECCGDWTPDGRYYIFQRGSGLLESQVLAAPETWRGTGKPEVITAGPLSFYAPAPTVDTNKFYVAGALHRSEIVRLDYRSGAVTPIPKLPSAHNLEYSRDGKWICYVTFPEGELWRSRPDGSERMQLTHRPVFASFPQWSPDGMRIAYVAYRVGELTRVEIVSIDGGEAEVPLAEHRGQGLGSWMPDGKSLIIGRLPQLEGSDPLPVKLVRVDLASHQPRELPQTDSLMAPSVSPDGRFIAAVKDDDTAAQLYEVATGRRVTLSQEAGTRPAWSWDGAYVYVVTDSGKLIRYGVNDGHATVVGVMHRMGTAYIGWFDDPGYLSLAPDGAPLATRNIGSSQLYHVEWR